ncbi:putative peptidoglycan lipid II flippase [Jatrophihabitans sp. GAS493]|uniref:murein biosynthesis integral membrane protein MurJ n=1 Tax=Jatrophihabitans sp. GAS493 TaxID=1907575 RepID=UPI000BB7164A|nr:murein biosynthesis integral membrane protein MurJ [Jatrophihabitans sp. GAS493]SOD71254.1 putative peptidoglycan lipid II flippase [Jatrophihabitans sp. GAS493]
MPEQSDEEDWGAASVYGRGLVTIEPSLYAGAAPIPGVMLPQWQQLTDAEEAAAAEVPWSQPTYGGRRKYRPRREPPVQPVEPPPVQPPPVPPDDDGPMTTIFGAIDAEIAPDQPVVAAGPEISVDQILADQVGTGEGTGESNQRVLASSRTMAIASLVSRLTGFARSLLLIAALGFLSVGDAYNTANNFPNIVYELLLGGVLSSVLIPLIVHAQEHDGDHGVAYTQRLLSIATAALAVATLVAVAAAPLIAAAYVQPGSKRELTSIFGTLLLPEIFFYGLGALVVAVLNTRRVYGPGAWAPVLNNVIVIATVGVFWSMPGPATLNPTTITTAQILVLGIGTTMGIVAQSLVLLPFLRRSGFRWQWRFRARPEERGRLAEVGNLAGWVIGYVVASQIGLWLVFKVANRHEGGAAAFAAADLIFQMPYGIIGVSLLTALMPRMSRSAARGETEAVIRDLSLGARLSSVALLPITAGLMVLGPTLGTVLFDHGANGPDKARHAGVAIALAAFGLVPFALVMLQLRVFYAMRDAKTPTIINIGMVAAKMVLVLLSAATLDSSHVVESLNVATSASYLVGAVVGHLLLKKRLGSLQFGSVWRTMLQVGAASAVGAVVAFAVLHGVTAALGTGMLSDALGLLLASAAGLVVMGLVAVRMRIPEVQDIVRMARR